MGLSCSASPKEMPGSGVFGPALKAQWGAVHGSVVPAAVVRFRSAGLSTEIHPPLTGCSPVPLSTLGAIDTSDAGAQRNACRLALQRPAVLVLNMLLAAGERYQPPASALSMRKRTTEAVDLDDRRDSGVKKQACAPDGAQASGPPSNGSLGGVPPAAEKGALDDPVAIELQSHATNLQAHEDTPTIHQGRSQQRILLPTVGVHSGHDDADGLSASPPWCGSRSPSGHDNHSEAARGQQSMAFAG